MERDIFQEYEKREDAAITNATMLLRAFCCDFTEAAIFFQRVEEVIVVSGISYNNGRCFIYSTKCQNSKRQRDFGGIGIYAMSDNHTAPENSFQP